MSYAGDIVLKVHGALGDAFKGTKLAGIDYSKATKSALSQDDIEACFRSTASAILAAEHLKAQSEKAVSDLRQCLKAMMLDSGCTSTGDINITVSLARKTQFVSIDDAQRIPRSFYVQKPPELDRDALKKALKGGEPVPGASLATPNDMQLRIQVKSA